MPLTPEEKAELTNDISQAVIKNVGEVVANAIKPVSDAVESLQANHQALSDTLTANQKAEEAEKRKAVAAKHGDVVANALSGDALDAMYKALGEPAPLGTNSGNDQSDVGAPDPATYFGGAK